MNCKLNEKINQVGESSLVIGIDIGSTTHYARAFDWRKMELAKVFRFSNTLEGFEALSRWIGNIQAQRKKEKVIVGIEPTGHYWFVLGQYLQGKGIKLVMVNPYAVKQSKELDDNNQTKNDAKDPSVIAKLVIDGRYSIPSLIQSNQHKLTLADSNRTIGIRAAITRDSATQITVPYQIDSGSNHVSLLITNKNDSWTAGSGWSTGAVKQYYATAAVSEANGTVTFTLPDNYETNKGNWKVWLLAEKVNGEHETDYASAPTAITVPNWIPVEKVTLSPSSAALVVGGDAVKLTASVSPNNATDKKVKWSVTGTGVALYSNEACSTALDLNTAISTTEVYAKGTAAGNATVTVTSNADSSKQASCSVTVKGIATVTTLPTAKSWVDNGNAQALAQAGAASGGTMVYAVTTTAAVSDAAAYSEAIPTEKEIGQ